MCPTQCTAQGKTQLLPGLSGPKLDTGGELDGAVSHVSELWDGASQGLKCALGVGTIIRRNSPTGDHFAGISTAQSGLLVALYHFVLEPLGTTRFTSLSHT